MLSIFNPFNVPINEVDVVLQVSVCSFFRAKIATNHPRPNQTGPPKLKPYLDIDHCSCCLPNPSIGPSINEAEGRRGALLGQEGGFACPIMQLHHRKLAKNHPITMVHKRVLQDPRVQLHCVQNSDDDGTGSLRAVRSQILQPPHWIVFAKGFETANITRYGTMAV